MCVSYKHGNEERERESIPGRIIFFPAGALRAPAGPKIVLVPPRSMFIYII